MAAEGSFQLEFSVPFQSDHYAQIAHTTLSVDKPPSRSQTQQELAVEGSVLKIRLSSGNGRHLRVAATSIMDHVVLVQKTMEKFGK